MEQVDFIGTAVFGAEDGTWLEKYDLSEYYSSPEDEEKQGEKC